MTSNTKKFYIYCDETFQQIDVLEKMLSLIIKVKVTLKKDGRFFEVSEIDDKSFNVLSLSINALKHDLQLAILAFIVIPVYEIKLIEKLKFTKSQVYYLNDYLLTSSELFDKDLLKGILKNVSKDILLTVKNYILQNQSVSQVAEIMFTHRNTINYRIAKFISLTSINIHDVNNQFFVYSIINKLEEKGE